ncbi:MAG: PH domain-containing protein [Candidatus Hodarchaeales archaeon]|jgi:uncharacterized membrane protein YdbT with pleckstrin-like domain
MTIQTQITLIKGDGTYPPPKTRRIYPTNSLLWKCYLKSFIIWSAAMGAIILIFMFFNFVADFDNEFVFFRDPEFQLLIVTVAFVCSLIVMPVVLVLLTLYVRNMEFIVHGDEVIVKKGIINKTVKYCPFRTITNISTHVGVFDRLFKIGCINIQTAGSGGMTGAPEEKLEGLKVYSEIREYIVLQLRYFTHTPTALPKHDLDEPKGLFQKNILTELKEIKKEFKKIKRSDVNE